MLVVICDGDGDGDANGNCNGGTCRGRDHKSDGNGNVIGGGSKMLVFVCGGVTQDVRSVMFFVSRFQAMGLFVVSTLCVAVHDETTAIATFTVWCWSLIGVYMLVTAALSLAHMMGVRADRGYGGQLLSAAVWVLFELLFTTAILVFVVVWFVLVPKAVLVVGP